MISAGLERMSNHPYAATIINEANLRSIQPSIISEISDGEAGVTGIIDGQRVMLGRADWLISEGIEFAEQILVALEESRKAGHGSSVLSIGGKAIACLSFYHDDAREGVSRASRIVR